MAHLRLSTSCLLETITYSTRCRFPCLVCIISLPPVLLRLLHMGMDEGKGLDQLLHYTTRRHRLESK